MTEVTREEFERLQNWYSELHLEMDQWRSLSLELIELIGGKASLLCEAGLCMTGDYDHTAAHEAADRVAGLAGAAPAKKREGDPEVPRNAHGALARIKAADEQVNGRMAVLAATLRGNPPPKGKKAG